MPAMDTIRSELAHQQAVDRLRAAYRQRDRLQAKLDQLAEVPWPSAAVLRRRGVLTVAVRDAEAHVHELEATAEVERVFGLAPVLEVGEGPRGRFDPPGWHVDSGTPLETWRLAPPAAARQRPPRAATPAPRPRTAAHAMLAQPAQRRRSRLAALQARTRSR